MSVYRGTDESGVFFTNRRDEAKARDPDYVEVEVPKNQKDLLPFLTILANEGRDIPEREETTEDPTPEPTDNPARELRNTEIRSMFDEAWEQDFPIALKLHYASLACETARTIVKEPTT